uniref:Uncharacterized protein n=1 Tax=Sphaerodactylus townsendi TaxID=933632 RepID=A0ACB8EF41_9SAUR
MVGGNQGFSVEEDQDDVSEGKVEDRDRPPSQEGSHKDKMADKSIPSQGGCFCESPVQEVRSTETRRKECAKQGICSRENKNENLAFEKTFTGDEQWNEGDETVLNKVQNEDLEAIFRNRDGLNKQKGRETGTGILAVAKLAGQKEQEPRVVRAPAGREGLEPLDGQEQGALVAELEQTERGPTEVLAPAAQMELLQHLAPLHYPEVALVLLHYPEVAVDPFHYLEMAFVQVDHVATGLTRPPLKLSEVQHGSGPQSCASHPCHDTSGS